MSPSENNPQDSDRSNDPPNDRGQGPTGTPRTGDANKWPPLQRPAPASSPMRTFLRNISTPLGVTVLCLLTALPFTGIFVLYRLTHSVTEDAFLETHMISLTSEEVAGHLVEITVQENDRFQKGDLLARIDPTPYQKTLEYETARLAVARSQLAKDEVALKLLKELVPKEISIATDELAVARDRQSEANERLAMIRVDVDAGIRAASHQVDAAKAAYVMAEENFRRYETLYQEKSAPLERAEEAIRDYRVKQADVRVNEAKLSQAEASKQQIAINESAVRAAEKEVAKAEKHLAIAKLGNIKIEHAAKLVLVGERTVEEAQAAVNVAKVRLNYTEIVAPFDGVVAKKYRHIGDYAAAGEAIFAIFDPRLVYVTAYMEETRMEGIAPGNHVDLDVFAFSKPFHGTVAWIGPASGANFALIPRDVTTTEFTWVVQRIPIRIVVDPDPRLDQLRPGYSLRVGISHGTGDPERARIAAQKLAEIEGISKLRGGSR